MKCSIHSSKELRPVNTKYGIRHTCDVAGCTVVAWEYKSGKTSVPADIGTRNARIMAHRAFDNLWRSGLVGRHQGYKMLSEYMGLPKKKTHIAMFSKEQCQKVYDFADSLNES